METALEEHRTEVGNTAPGHASRQACRMRAESFVRWLKGRFAPGTRVNRRKHALMTLPEFLARYGTEERCFDALLRWRWPSGIVCPYHGAGHRAVRSTTSSFVHCFVYSVGED